jgi:hypothetical protein
MAVKSVDVCRVLLLAEDLIYERRKAINIHIIDRDKTIQSLYVA